MQKTSVWLLVLSILFVIGIIFLAVYLPSNYLSTESRPLHPTLMPTDTPNM